MGKELIDNLKIGFANPDDWKKIRNLLLVKLFGCKTEEEFADILERLIASMFTNVKELSKARKKFRMKVLTEKEKANMKEKIKQGKRNDN